MPTLPEHLGRWSSLPPVDLVAGTVEVTHADLVGASQAAVVVASSASGDQLHPFPAKVGTLGTVMRRDGRELLHVLENATEKDRDGVRSSERSPIRPARTVPATLAMTCIFFFPDPPGPVMCSSVK